MKNLGCTLLALAGFAAPTMADTNQCSGLGVVIEAPTETLAEMICESAAEALELFETCNVPTFRTPLRIEVVDSLSDGCVGIFHCGEDRIELLDPEVLEQRRNMEGAFAFLPVEDYFRSIVVYELAHAGFDTLDCPFDSCITSSEYVAYNMQVMSLPSNQQVIFSEQANTDERVSRTQISVAMLFMAPNLFAQRAWAHLQQREDPCGYIGQITDGHILLDRERF